jgi:hypothetical protein
MSELTPEAQLIRAKHDALPRDVQKVFSTYERRARERLAKMGMADESLVWVEGWNKFLLTPTAKTYFEMQAAEPEDAKVLPIRVGASVAVADDAEAETLPEEPEQPEPGPIGARAIDPEPAPNVMPPPAAVLTAPIEVQKPVRSEATVAERLKYALFALRELHSLRYGLFKLICYAALIPASAQAVVAFFTALDAYGSWTRIFAYVLTASVDLLAIDLLTRSVRDLKVKFTVGALSLGLSAGAVIALNVVLTRMNMHNSANLEETASVAQKYKTDLKEKEAVVTKAQAEFSAARGKFLSLKWPGATDAEGCDTGAVKCRGPFVTNNPSAIEAQAEMLTRKSDLDAAKDVKKDFEAAKPVAPAGALKVSEGMLTQRLAFYCVLWGLIVLASFAAPAPMK